MAMINCPECNKEISEHAKTCPNCGFEFAVKPKKTPLGAKEVNKVAGVTWIVVGICAVLVGLFTVGVIIGFLFIFAGLGMIGMGANNMSGMQKGKCPYCNSDALVSVKATTYKCSECKKVSQKKEEYLETID